MTNPRRLVLVLVCLVWAGLGAGVCLADTTYQVKINRTDGPVLNIKNFTTDGQKVFHVFYQENRITIPFGLIARVDFTGIKRYMDLDHPMATVHYRNGKTLAVLVNPYTEFWGEDELGRWEIDDWVGKFTSIEFVNN